MKKEDKEILVRIDRYIRGELREEEKERLWKDFLRKPEYYHWFETELHLRRMKESDGGSGSGSTNGKEHLNGMPGGRVLNGNGSPVMSMMSQMRPYTWVVAAAAVLTIIFGLRFFLLQDSSDVHDLAINRIDATELSGAGITRSDDQVGDSDQVALSRGIAFAYNGDEADAAEQFILVLQTSNNQEMVSKAVLNLGIVRYNQQNFEEASMHFSRSLQSGALTAFQEEKTRWFLANSYLNLGQNQNTLTELDAILDIKGRYETAAFQLKQNLTGSGE
ncbi:tetratricopeptide repeat protein [Rhodohalobacter mucosus]|uniref:Uncharacterized protein n=1 Tax=Rhodohalobacter mucosus TaxID=2079485 RepID=A0A316TT20_9BACT|nr:hypothetical protein [Rhodohalobacter mucosus]PWN07763.1 hypothetical protein DDZ15_01740 [Rhodohalobacter mucosus]